MEWYTLAVLMYYRHEILDIMFKVYWLLKMKNN